MVLQKGYPGWELTLIDESHSYSYLYSVKMYKIRLSITDLFSEYCRQNNSLMSKVKYCVELCFKNLKAPFDAHRSMHRALNLSSQMKFSGMAHICQDIQTFLYFLSYQVFIPKTIVFLAALLAKLSS